MDASQEQHYRSGSHVLLVECDRCQLRSEISFLYELEGMTTWLIVVKALIEVCDVTRPEVDLRRLEPAVGGKGTQRQLVEAVRRHCCSHAAAVVQQRGQHDLIDAFSSKRSA